jgi:hypothetical protein
MSSSVSCPESRSSFENLENAFAIIPFENEPALYVAIGNLQSVSRSEWTTASTRYGRQSGLTVSILGSCSCGMGRAGRKGSMPGSARRNSNFFERLRGMRPTKIPKISWTTNRPKRNGNGWFHWFEHVGLIQISATLANAHPTRSVHNVTSFACAIRIAGICRTDAGFGGNSSSFGPFCLPAVFSWKRPSLKNSRPR